MASLPNKKHEAPLPGTSDPESYITGSDFNAIIDAANGLNPIVATGTTTGRTLNDRFADVINVKDFGAKGDGATDDTAALQAAINAGRAVRCRAGDTYLVNGGLVSSLANQVIDFSGCVVKLKTAASSKGVLRLDGDGARVVGGTWDLNVSGNPTDTDSGYSTWAVCLNGSNQSVENTYVKNSLGLGLKATSAPYATVRNNRIEGAGVMGIYADGSTTADVLGVRIDGNVVDFSGSTTAQGIGLYSASPYTYVLRRFSISNNSLLGPLASASNSSVAVTVRGYQGVVQGNRIVGSSMGISVDRSHANDSVVSGNVISGLNGTTGYGIEINGGSSVISGNVIDGGRYGVTGSISTGGVAGDSMDNLTISGNVLKNQTLAGVYLAPGTGWTARHAVITGNTISPVAGGKAVYLLKDCLYAVLSGNIFAGADSAQGRGIYLDSVNSDVLIKGNRFSGWQRAVGVYNGSAVAQARIVFDGNDVSENMPAAGATVLLNLEGSATWGTGVRVTNNATAVTTVFRDDILDRANLLIDKIDAGVNTPEGNVTAGIGSVFRGVNSGQANYLFVKQSGTGNTGWVAK